MRRNAVETVLGAVVLLVAGIFLFFAASTAEVRSIDGYQLTARFYKVGGLAAGSDVRINGIKVGTVKTLRLDPETFDAVAVLSIQPGTKVPADTVAMIGSEGVIGSKYVRLDPGNAGEPLEAGASITKTRDFRSLEDQVSDIIFLATGGNNNK